MGVHTITLQHSTDSAHRVVGHEGKCARLHGHTYHWTVEVSASSLRDPQFVIDFAVIKRVLNAWDHRTLLWDQDPFVVMDSSIEHLDNEPEQDDQQGGVVRLPVNPTSEHLSKLAAEMIYTAGLLYNPSIEEVTVVCSETPKSHARYTHRASQ